MPSGMRNASCVTRSRSVYAFLGLDSITCHDLVPSNNCGVFVKREPLPVIRQTACRSQTLRHMSIASSRNRLKKIGRVTWLIP